MSDVTSLHRSPARMHAEFLAASAWARRPDDACDLVFGDPREMPPAAYVEALRRAADARDPSHFAYKGNTPAARAAACGALRERLGIAFEPADVFLTRGASGALAVALAALVAPGDEVIYLSPPWFFYESMIAFARAVPVAVGVDPRGFDPDVDAIAAAITSRTRAVIVNTPNNPTGRIYPDRVLAELAAALTSASAERGAPVFLLSDEAYNRIVFDGRPFSSPAAHYAHTLLLYSYGKTLLTPGQRLGYLALAPWMPDRHELREAILLAQFAGGGFGVPDALLQHALPELEPLCVDLDRLARRRDLLCGALREQGYEVHPPEGTFYMLLRSPTGDEAPFVEALAERGVYVLPGRMVGMPGWVRISLTATDEMCERSLDGFAGAARLYSARLGATYPRGRKMSPQEYACYTDEDFEVWRILYERQIETLAGKVCDEFFDGLEALGLEASTIPEFESFSDRLEAASGWRVEAVEGQLPGREYWSLITSRRFPSATTLRGRHELSHARDPDMFHDVFGHLPLLADPTYSEFLRGMSRIALDHLEVPGTMRRLGRVYKWTIEYGVMRSNGGHRIYGAGLISSSKEIDHVFGDAAEKRPFSVEEAFATKHVPASLQPAYFVVESFDQLLDSLPEIERTLREAP